MKFLRFFLVGAFPGIQAKLQIQGASPDHCALFTGPTFTCFDGSKTIEISAVNDDYCDCDDGSDEPGTSACGNGQFYCENLGHLPYFVPSSRVNDGICETECCDGSDEYSGRISCPNVCAEAARDLQRKLQQVEDLRLRGLELKAEYIEFGKNIKKNYRSELVSLESELNDKRKLLGILEIQKTENEKALKEYRNGSKMEKYEKLLVETKAELVHLQDELHEIENQIRSLGNLLVSEETEDGNEKSPATLETFKETIRKVLESFKQLDFESFYSLPLLHDNTISQTFETNQERPIDEIPLSIAEKVFEYYDKCAVPLWDTFISAITGKKPPTEESQIEKDAELTLQKYSEMERLVGSLSSKISEIKNRLDINYGPDNVFAKLHDSCFEGKNDDYTYEICPFKESKQKKDGSLIATLGNWAPWPESNANFKVMKFTGGTNCWNGPQRSMTVLLECGLENRVITVSEPSKCEYVMKFSSPIACM